MSLSQAIISTLFYHSRFNYPLTFEELHRFLVINYPLSSNEVKKELSKLTGQKKIIFNPPFYHLPNSANLANLPNLRRARSSASRPKLLIARRAARFIGLIPSVKLVCLTGALAMENSDPDDDIDLMIVTSEDRLWLTRPLVILLVSLFFKRRRPNSANLPNLANLTNSICLNLWLDSSALAMPPRRQNLLTAHELAQMKPLINKGYAYERMMRINRWGSKYLANTWKRVKGYKVTRLQGYQDKKPFNLLTFYPSNLLTFYPSNLLNLLNLLAFRLQLWYMKPKITSEEVNLHSAFFHPGGNRN